MPAAFDPLRAEPGAALIVYIDYKSPYAFIAKDPTYALADELGVVIDWRPIILDIPSYLGSARLDASDRVIESERTPEQWSGVRYAYQDARRYARRSGYTLRGTVKIWDSRLAGIGMLWAKAAGVDVLRRYTDLVYLRFWRRELDIEDIEVVLGVLSEAGAPTIGARDYLCGEGLALLELMQPAIFDAGIFGVPSYVLDGEFYFGREHLPLLRWKLSGSRGPAPDIAFPVPNASTVHDVQTPAP